MRLIKPPRLKKGDLIGIVSPASSPEDYNKIIAGIEYIKGQGYNVTTGKNIDKVLGYLAGTDDERVQDIHSMFSNKEVKAVFCLRGGYGASRLLDKIDYDLIRKNPKIFVGYSEITALQMAILKKSGLVTFAGPMTAVDLANGVTQFTEDNFWQMLTSNKKAGKITCPEHEKLNSITKGKGSGTLIGGNLSVYLNMTGTEYLPKPDNSILFLEEISERPYKIDRMFNQMRLSGYFSKLKGIILGAFVDCNESDPQKKTLTLSEVVGDYFSSLKIPVLYNFPNGHVKDIFTIAYGINVKINGNDCTVEYTEGGVS